MKEISIDQVKQAIVILSVMLEIEEEVKVSLENKPILNVIKDIAYHLFEMNYNHNAEMDKDIYDAYEIVLSYAEKSKKKKQLTTAGDKNNVYSRVRRKNRRKMEEYWGEEPDQCREYCGCIPCEDCLIDGIYKDCPKE